MQSVASHHHLLIRHRFRRHIQIEYEMMRSKRNERRKNEEDENNRFLFGSRSRGYVVNVCECVSFCWYKDALRSVANQHVSVSDEWIDAKSDGMEPNNRYGLHYTRKQRQTSNHSTDADVDWNMILFFILYLNVMFRSNPLANRNERLKNLFFLSFKFGWDSVPQRNPKKMNVCVWAWAWVRVCRYQIELTLASIYSQP